MSDQETVKETLKEIICSGPYALDAEDILRKELSAEDFSDQDFSTVINFAKKYSSCQVKWIDAYANRLCEIPSDFLHLTKKCPTGARAMIRLCIN